MPSAQKPRVVLRNITVFIKEVYNFKLQTDNKNHPDYQQKSEMAGTGINKLTWTHKFGRIETTFKHSSMLLIWYKQVQKSLTSIKI